MALRPLHSPIALLLVCAALVGCTSPEAHRLMARTIAPATAGEIADTHDVFVATNRAGTEAPGEIFSGQRSQDAAFARVTVSVPATHETGLMELAPNPAVADPARYFTARRASLYPDDAAFETALREDIAARGGRALVFIHGYNTGFDEAVYRATQIFHDSHYSGAPILFSWPSAGRALNYVYDHNSATAARDALERTLRLVARAGATQIDIVAHSMGSWVAMEALRQLAIKGDRDLGGRLANIVLAAPDIDIDVFKSQMRRYGMPDDQFIVLTSHNDRALTLSGFIARSARLGDYRDSEELAALGVTVVDVTNTDSTDWLNHTKFAKNPLLIELLGRRLAAEGNLDEGEDDPVAGHIERLVRGIGQTVGSAADIIVTTPLKIIEGAARP